MPFPYVFPAYFESCPPLTGITVTVRMAFGDDMFDTTPNWSDVSADVLEVHTKRGRKHELDRMEAGTCTLVLDNASGDYYPDNAGGTYFPDIKTMARVNVRATYDGAPVVDVFSGYVESWTPSWLGKSGKGPIVKVVCSDALKIYARTLLNNAGEAAELSGTRVGNVADEVLWPAAWRDLDTGQETLQATGAQANVNSLNHLQLAQESELSLVYIAPDNDLQFEDRSHRTNAPHDAAELVFGDDGEIVGEDRYEDIKFIMDETLLFNDIRMTRIGGAEQTSSNAASQTAYGKRSLSRTGLLNNSDLATEILADFIVARHADTVIRVKSITIRPGKNPGSLWYKVLNYDISTRVTIRLDQASVDKDYFIEGVAHDWDSKSYTFITRWEMSDATQDFSPPDAKDEYLRPTAAGDVTNITSQFPAATFHWDKVDEAVADEDTTYVREDAAVNYDLYNLSNSVYGAGTINSVTVVIRIRREALGTLPSSNRIKVKVGGVEYNYQNSNVNHTNYQNYSEVLAVSPNTTVAWTWAEVNALQIGCFLDDGTFNVSDMRCTQVYAVVNFTPAW